MSKQADAKKYKRLVNRFINLANNMQAEGQDVQVVANALMTACGAYATYAAVGSNQGGLTESGVNKVTQAFAMRLMEVQAGRRAEAEAAANEGQGGEVKH